MTGNEAKYATLRGAWGAGVPTPVLREIVRRVRWPKTVRLFGTSEKVEKGGKQGVLTTILYGAPAGQLAWAGVPSQCPNACKGCIKACLGRTAGRMVYGSVRNAQNWKTLLWWYAPQVFLNQAVTELRAHGTKARRLGKIPAARVNGTTDRWRTADTLAERVPGVRFYDYTKAHTAAWKSSHQKSRVHRTFSYSGGEKSLARSLLLLQQNGNVAVVFRTRDPAKFPDTWHGYPVINGDETDIRFRDPPGTVVGLTAKGTAMKDDTGFVEEI